MVWNTPSTWAAGAILTAAQLNAQVRDNFNAIGDPWTAYTPTWAGTTASPTLGNGTLTGRYMQAGKWVQYRIRVTFGSTTNVGSGIYSWTLPVAALATQMVAGQGLARNAAGNSRAYRFARVSTATTVVLEDAAGAQVTHAAPLAWANGDIIDISGSYEAA